MSSVGMVAPILANCGNNGISVNLFDAGGVVVFRRALEPANHQFVSSPDSACMASGETSGGLVGWTFDLWKWQGCLWKLVMLLFRSALRAVTLAESCTCNVCQSTEARTLVWHIIYNRPGYCPITPPFAGPGPRSRVCSCRDRHGEASVERIKVCQKDGCSIGRIWRGGKAELRYIG
jgi:hypothetical protein